ncbi:MAG TPA: YfiR family protein [Vicinamibacterales bacterium]|nr:YfiR family protein [Vicinamibacterales bacterium]
MRRIGPLLVAIGVAIAGAAAPLGAVGGEQASDVDVKAAFLFNFAKFTNWPDLAGAAPIQLCVVGDEPIGSALAQLTRGQTIDQHPVVVRTGDVASPVPCHLLFLSSRVHDVAAVIDLRRALPILTVGDGDRFTAAGGMIQLFVESSRMRFAINVDAVQRAHLKISSRVLGLAKIVKDDHAQ